MWDEGVGDGSLAAEPLEMGGPGYTTCGCWACRRRVLSEE